MERRLSAILAADVVGYSRLMGQDEVGTLRRLNKARCDVLQPMIDKHYGRTVKLMGDGLLAEFPSAVEAIQCAVNIQAALSDDNAGLQDDQQILYRIGVNIGDIIVEDEDIYGDGVNIAARIEQLGEPGDVVISSAARDQVFDKINVSLEDLGEVQVKNITHPIHLYRVAGHHHSDPHPKRFSTAAHGKPSIAVLPFVNMSGDPEQEYFSDGITEDIITSLSRLRWFFVIARNSSFIYKGQHVDVKQVGRKLGVRYVLEGSVRKAGNRIRVTAQLVDALSGAHYWAQTYDRDVTDIFELQDDITQSVTSAIEPKLVAAEGLRSENRSSNDLDAWDLVMRALTHYWRMTPEECSLAIEMLQSAVKSHPDYGPAHSMLAFAILVSGHVGWTWTPESQDYRYAEHLAHRAAELDEEDPWAHLALGYLAFTNRDTDEAVKECHRALELNPNFATAYGYLGWALAFDGQSEAAIEHFARAIRMSPHDPLIAFFYSGTGVAHYLAGRYEDAVEWGRKAIRKRPGFTAAYRILCASLAQAGHADETRAVAAKLRELQPNISIRWCEEHVPYTSRAMPHFLEGLQMAGIK